MKEKKKRGFHSSVTKYITNCSGWMDLDADVDMKRAMPLNTYFNETYIQITA